jgi:hypothetical protein
MKETGRLLCRPKVRKPATPSGENRQAGMFYDISSIFLAWVSIA